MHKRKILGLILVAAGIILLIAGLFYEGGKPESAVGLEEPECQAGWLNLNAVILAGSGDVYLIRGNDSGATVYETTVFYLQAMGVVNSTSLNETEQAIKNGSAIEAILSGSPPAVVRVNVGPGQGYKIFLPAGKCITSHILDTLFPNEVGVEVSYAGRSVVPVDVPQWPYYGKELPRWSLYYEGKNVGDIWVDTEQGLIVAERAGEGYIIHVLEVIPLPQP